ncbi:MAG: GNAT family N-acetyltransferase, partial [Planctomycetota bacterium]
MNAPIETIPAGQMSEDDLRRVCVLQNEAFPRPDRTVEDRIAKDRGGWVEGDFPAESQPRAFIIRDDDRVVAVAMTLVRTINTQDGPRTVLGLAGVATAQSHRGRGLGQRVIRAAWAPVDDGERAVCLFHPGRAR